MPAEVHHGDCLELMREMPDGCFDLTCCSPPYVDCRTYGIGFRLKGQAWVDWCVPRFLECLRVTRGLVVWVVEGKTKNFRYDMTPILLGADLHRAGVHFRKPPAFYRVGIPGSGGPDWWRNDYELILCAVGPAGGKLPWSDNTAMGHLPRWAPGGAMSNRLSNGSRVNRDQWGSTGNATGMAGRYQNGSHKRLERGNEKGSIAKRFTRGKGNADGTMGSRPNPYNEPPVANPGNVIRSKRKRSNFVECIVGGGVMGSKLAHENEAPYPEQLVEPFVRSFCRPGGKVFDPFCGSGTTLAVALRCGRNGYGIDVRESQVELTRKRIAEVQIELV